MTLPTFLGIGVMRGGSTWLHELLSTHPDIYVPKRRKEIYFFDLYYDRGLEWYEQFFPKAEEARRFRALGEITPTYFYRPYGPERIAGVPSITRLLLILRNPIDRLNSHYGLLVKNGQYSGSLDSFLAERPDMIQQGFYSRYLKNFLARFGREQILVLIYEDATADVTGTKATLGRFLDVSADRFPVEAGTKSVNRSYRPRAALGYALARRVAWYHLRYGWNLDWVVNWGKRLGIESLFGDAGRLPSMKPQTKSYLQGVYEPEIRELESLLQTDLARWG